MAADSRLHAEAQRYYALGVRAATEAGDRPLGAHILATMAGQMIEHGSPAEGLELVRLAQQGARGTVTPTMTALLYVRESWAQVKMCESAKAERAVHQAEEVYAAARPTEDPYWLRYCDPAEFSGVCGSRFRDLQATGAANVDRSAARYEAALTLREPKYLRSKALDYTGLAKVQLIKGEVDQACATASRAIDIAGQLSSGVLESRIADFQTKVAPYRKSPAVRTFNDKARTELRMTA